jgi:diguanylate cyclase (GGDEF)-like protein
MMTERPHIPSIAARPPADMLLEANEQLVLAMLRGDSILPSGAPWTDRRFAERDALTGLPGRAALQESFDASAVAAQREGKRLGILFLDLDGFKEVNDGLSHRAGDAALRHVARCLNASVRGSDTVSRHGGDEFVILLADLPRPSDAEAVAQKILSSLMAPERIAGHALSMSASIGVSIYPDDGDSLDELIHAADAAMYRAKRLGAGYYVFHGGGQPVATRGAGPRPVPGVIYPHAASTTRERMRQAQMQEANEQLLLAALAARELQLVAERALGEQTALLARVAHELRNPLAPISMAAALLERADAEDLPRLRAVIERQVEHVSRLVSDLLDLSRAQAGKLRLQRTGVDMGGLVSEVIEACRPAMEGRRQRLVVDIHEGPLLVIGDRVRLAQVLSNLFDNASKYTPAEGVVTVAVHGEGSEVVVAVSDSGIGIRNEALAKVFEPFAQEANATRFHGAGLGIGLTVVRELVEAHGGTVRASSAGEGRGSQFVLRLPRHLPATDSTAGASATAAAPTIMGGDR